MKHDPMRLCELCGIGAGKTVRLLHAHELRKAASSYELAPPAKSL